jgi:hypothetical protein
MAWWKTAAVNQAETARSQRLKARKTLHKYLLRVRHLLRG